jgi:hypothetical protein
MLLALAAVLAFPATASAAPVLVLGRHDRVHRRDDPYLNGPALTPVPSITASPAARSRLAARPDTSGGVPLPGAGASGNRPPKKKKKKKKTVTVRWVLAALERRGRISPAQQHQALQAFNAALATERTLSGTRRAELSSVTTTIHQIAAEGQLWPSRLPLVEATLNANRQWWAHGTLLSYGQRVMFAGSELEWQYYPGQGIQLQITQLTQLLSELIPLATGRGGGLTWEYLFSFDGGSPPWTSAMSQATALQALSHAYQATHDVSYLTTAARALTIFTRTPAQNGVMVRTPHGVRFVQYTFTPGTPILNAFLQSLIGLDTYAQVSGNPTAAQLFAEGNAEALWEVPRFNTGAWSLYQPGEEDDLSYHELVTGFLQKLCALTGAATYCTTASAFSADLRTPPAITALTHRARARRPFALRFRLSKISKVGITIRRGPRVIEATSATFPYGVQSISVPRLPPGAYAVTLTATDLAGNYTRDPASALTVMR